jgi:hypothetical protein
VNDFLQGFQDELEKIAKIKGFRQLDRIEAMLRRMTKEVRKRPAKQSESFWKKMERLQREQPGTPLERSRG